MADREELKRKAIREIDKLSDEEVKEYSNDRRRLRDWLKGVLREAWSIIKSAIGGLIAAIFG